MCKFKKSFFKAILVIDILSFSCKFATEIIDFDQAENFAAGTAKS